MRKRFVILALLAMLTLSGCGAKQSDVDNTTAFLNALNTGDVETARQFVCEDDMDGIIQGLSTNSANDNASWAFQNVSCSAYGGDVKCSYSVTQKMDDGTTQQLGNSVVFDFEDGKICGFEVSPAD
jgi:hypothetical protein